MANQFAPQSMELSQIQQNPIAPLPAAPESNLSARVETQRSPVFRPPAVITEGAARERTMSNQQRLSELLVRMQDQLI